MGTPRSGSTLLCRLMAATGSLGNPDEYFRRVLDKGRAGKPDRLAAAQRSGLAGDDIDSRIALAKSHGTTANGVCSFKLFANHFEFGARSGDFLSHFPKKTFVCIYRADLLGQAISFALAKQTKKFRSYESSNDQDPTYDGGQIDALLTRISNEDVAWRRYFARRDITPLSICYEVFVANPMPVLYSIAARAGIELSADFSLDEAKMSVQRGEINRQWRNRYIAEKGHGSGLGLSAETRWGVNLGKFSLGFSGKRASI